MKMLLKTVKKCGIINYKKNNIGDLKGMDENKVYVSKETNEEGFTLVELWRIIQANIIWLILAVVLFIFLDGYILSMS